MNRILCIRKAVLFAAAVALAVRAPASEAQTNQAPGQKSGSTAAATQADKAQAGAKETAHQAGPADNGDVLFAQNCNRCHTAPDKLAPRYTGTVLRHMRVRASLSEADEKALLLFLNPQ